MRTIVTPLLFAAVTGLATPALADDTQYWQTVTVNVALPDSFRLQNETVLRTSDARGFYELENNFMAGKRVGKVTTLWLGYTYDPQYNHGDFTRREHRFRQQVSFDGFAVIGKARLSSRLRLEERWREGLQGTGWRLRPQVRATLPLTGKVMLTAASEPFINLNNTVFQAADGLDRVRNSISLGVPLGNRFTLDVGYLNQHGFVAGGPDTSDHLLTTGIAAAF